MNDWQISGSSYIRYIPYSTGSLADIRIVDNVLNIPPDVWRCAYCSQLQSKTKDVIIRAHKIQEHVHKCSVCGAPKMEMRDE